MLIDRLPLPALAVVYLKNRINRGWAPSEDNTNTQHKRIPDDERPALRDRLIPILAVSPANVRAQFIPIVTKILSYDFPEKWPGFMDITLQLLGTNDANSVFAGLQCLLAICKVYRFKANEKRGDFDKIVEHCFPQLLNIGNRLVDEESLEAAEMLHTVVKAYKHAIYVGSFPLVFIIIIITIIIELEPDCPPSESVTKLFLMSSSNSHHT